MESEIGLTIRTFGERIAALEAALKQLTSEVEALQLRLRAESTGYLAEPAAISVPLSGAGVTSTPPLPPGPVATTTVADVERQ
jgi:hypothetical protein